MRKIEKRTVICMALAILLAAGMAVFLIKYFAEGGKWASSAFNRHLYDSNGILISGRVLDRDGDVLSDVEGGKRTYYDNVTVRKATLHAVGDLYGKIGTGALNAFADKLTGFDLINLPYIEGQVLAGAATRVDFLVISLSFSLFSVPLNPPYVLTPFLR